MFAALVIGLILLGVVGFVAIEGVGRLLDPAGTVVLGTPMLIVAAIGGLANVASLLVLRGGRRNSINMRGAYLEILGDLVGSIAVVIAVVIILLTGFVAADGIASLVVAGLIVSRALSLLRVATSVPAESTPRGTDVALIRDHVLSTPGAVGVHDVRVWAITPGVNVFSAHVVVEPRVFSEGVGRACAK